MTGTLDGLRVIIHPWLPETPTPQQDIVRMVRHQMADILACLGEDPGPAPGELTHAYTYGGALYVSAALYDRIKELCQT